MGFLIDAKTVNVPEIWHRNSPLQGVRKKCNPSYWITSLKQPEVENSRKVNKIASV